jgi:HEPN domain-containing protein
LPKRFEKWEKFYMKKITKDWFNSAVSDLSIIEQIIDQPDLTHQASFHAQQAIEKSFKALIEEFELGFIKTHSLEMLYNKVKNIISLEIDTDQLILLDQLYIDARYPGEMGLLPDGKPSIQESKIFLVLSKAIYASSVKICE